MTRCRVGCVSGTSADHVEELNAVDMGVELLTGRHLDDVADRLDVQISLFLPDARRSRLTRILTRSLAYGAD